MLNNIKKSIVILFISPESLDYDLVLNYLLANPYVKQLFRISQGFLFELEMYREDRRVLFGTLIQSEVTNIEVYDIL